MQYDRISNLTNKEQSHEASLFANHWKTQAGSSYDYGYQYDSGKPHAPSQIGQRNYQHDANGNQTGWELPTGILDLIQERRVLEWDEENRLKNVANNSFGLLSDEYVYDHAGERTIKREGVSVISYLNAHATINSASQLTKHIYAGSQRIVTKVAGEVTQTLIDPATGLNGYQSSYGGFSNPDVFYRNFYHPDHLGSTSYVTDASGVISEHIAYFPTGETWSEQSGFGFSVPYKFTSKELDASTGLYYHGARYCDPRTSVWQSADPILGSYLDGAGNGGVFNPHNLGLYTYGYNNPVNYNDPTGEVAKLVATGGKVIYKAYKYYKRHGSLDKGSPKKIGGDELIGIADDLNTIFADNSAGFFDKLGAGIDLLTGLETTDGQIREVGDVIGFKKRKGVPKNRADYEIEPSSNTGITTRDGRVLEGGTVKSRTDYIDDVPQRRVDFDHSHGELDRGHVVDIHVNPRNSSQLNTSRARSPEPGEYLSPVLSDPRIQGGVFKP